MRALKLSPPKQPIVFYLEHTVPVRYRRYVKQGVLSWNEAFEKVGISDAVVVHYQDKSSGRPHGEGSRGRALQLRPLALQ